MAACNGNNVSERLFKFILTESGDLGIPTASLSTKLGVLPKPNTV